MLKVVMARGRRVKKVRDSEAQKQNVTSSEQTIREQNNAPSKLGPMK